jgi:hypothetical protein
MSKSVWLCREAEMNKILEGVVQNGMIVLKNGVRLPEGTPVKVSIEPTAANAGIAANGSFFRSATIDELAAAQGITSPCSFDALLGGWPADEREAKFEEAVAAWRKEESGRGEF